MIDFPVTEDGLRTTAKTAVGARRVAGAVSVTVGVGRTGAETDVTPLKTDVAGNPRKAAGARKPLRTGGEIGAGMTPGMGTNVVLS